MLNAIDILDMEVLTDDWKHDQSKIASLMLNMNKGYKNITDVVTKYGHGETIGRILGLRLLISVQLD